MLCMLDFETLDTTPTAQVLSIGAFKFDPYVPLTVTSLDDFKQAHASQCFQALMTPQPNRTISVDTVMWWMQQSSDALSMVSKQSRNQWENVLVHDFPAWYASGPRPEQCYSFPGTFDLPILQSLYDQLGASSPIRYYEWRDLRTLGSVTKVERKSVSTPYWIVEHDALHDCIKQALWVQACYARL